MNWPASLALSVFGYTQIHVPPQNQDVGPSHSAYLPYVAVSYTHLNTLCGVGDTASSYIAWYFGQFCRGTKLTPAEEEERYRQVTREDIIAAAKRCV